MNEDQPSDLSRAIESLYDVFASYALPETEEFCTHCVTKDEDAALRNKSLRGLQSSDVSRYWWKAVSTWGSVDQFKHFLPRLLEILVSQELPHDTEILVGKLRYAGFEDWPEVEKEVIHGFCVAVWQEALSHHPLTALFPSFPSIDTCLCTLAQVENDLIPLLYLWDQDSRSAAQLHLIDFANENVADIRETGQMWNTFWGERPDQMRQVRDWFLAHDFAIAFDVAIAQTTNDELREDISRAIRKRNLRVMICPSV